MVSTSAPAPSSAAKSAATSSVPTAVAQSESGKKRLPSTNPVPVLAAAVPIATSSEVYQAAQGLTNLYDTKAFQTLADSSDSEEDYY